MFDFKTCIDLWGSLTLRPMIRTVKRFERMWVRHEHAARNRCNPAANGRKLENWRPSSFSRHRMRTLVSCSSLSRSAIQAPREEHPKKGRQTTLWNDVFHWQGRSNPSCSGKSDCRAATKSAGWLDTPDLPFQSILENRATCAIRYIWKCR
jgi:hypothetical protein